MSLSALVVTSQKGRAGHDNSVVEVRLPLMGKFFASEDRKRATNGEKYVLKTYDFDPKDTADF